MPPGFPPPQPHGKVEEKLAADIDREGWAAIGVMPTVDDPCDPWIYTLGLWRKFDHPEIIITGMNHETSHALLGIFVDRIAQGKTFEAGKDYPEAIAGRNGPYTAAFRAVTDDNRREFMRFAGWWNAGETFPAVQLLWPDPTGKFPWDEGYDRRFIQPVLDATD